MTARTPYRDRSAYPAFRTIPTRWHDNDSYGHVNNTVYYGWFDTAVNAHLIEAGVLDLAAGPSICLVVETGCRYAQAVSFPETVDAGIRVASLGTSSVRYEIGLFAGEGESAAAEGFFVHVHVDRATRRPCPFPPDWRHVLGALAG